MKGIHSITVQNKRLHYQFELKRNITVIRGDSATGKTTLIDMIQEYYEDGEESGILLQSDKECVVVSSNRRWKQELAGVEDSIVFIDEGNKFIFGVEFASYIKSTDNYYVIVTREGIPTLPYSVKEIYGIKNSGKYGNLKQIYNEFYPFYTVKEDNQIEKKEMIITEDSNSGYQFFESVSNEHGIKCETANGKSNIFSKIEYLNKKKEIQKILVIADGAAFGAEIEKIEKMRSINNQIDLYLPESFEWMILESGILEGNKIKEILKNPADYIECKEYFSWERFFTELLVKETSETQFPYLKSKLNEYYKKGQVRDKILSVMKKDLT